MMKFVNWMMLGMLVWSLQLNAQTVPPALQMKFDQVLDSMQGVLKIKSLGAAVQLNNDAVWAGASGISTVNPLDSVTTHHAYLIGSVVKTITSACILQLADEGVLSLNDSLHKWLDTIEYINPNITIRQLLRHQSGVFDVLYHPDFNFTIQSAPSVIWSLSDVVNTFILAPNFLPGTGWAYSNTNYMLLGMIIEKATGHPYYQEFKTRFFQPLHLNSLKIPPFDGLPDTIAHPWLDITNDGVLDDIHDLYITWNSLFSAAGPAGCYFAKPADIAVWMRTFLGKNLVSANMLNEAKTTVATNLPGPTRYGLGVMERNYLGIKGYGHGGDLTYSSTVFYFPSKDISIAVLGNDGSKTSWKLAPVMTALLKAYMDYCALVATDAPKKLDLGVNIRPNPFRDFLEIEVNLPHDVTTVCLQLYNEQGQNSATKTFQAPLAGVHNLRWDGLSDLAPGIYTLGITVDGQRAQSIKVLKPKA
jgi:D-alanyl-D-alanine carboxypeptidase